MGVVTHEDEFSDPNPRTRIVADVVRRVERANFEALDHVLVPRATIERIVKNVVDEFRCEIFEFVSHLRF